MFLDNLIYVASHLRIYPAVHLLKDIYLKYFESSDAIVIKKKSLLNVYYLSLIF